MWYWRAMEQLHKLWVSCKYDEVISFCNALLAKKPTDFFAFYYRGLANEKLGLLKESLGDFEQSYITLTNYKRKRLLKEYFTQIPIHISRIYRKMQDNEKAFEYADKAVEVDVTEIDGLKWRASLKEDNGDYTGASEDLNEAMKRGPKNKTLMKLRDRLTYIIIQDMRETASR